MLLLAFKASNLMTSGVYPTDGGRIAPRLVSRRSRGQFQESDDSASRLVRRLYRIGKLAVDENARKITPEANYPLVARGEDRIASIQDQAWLCLCAGMRVLYSFCGWPGSSGARSGQPGYSGWGPGRH